MASDWLMFSGRSSCVALNSYAAGPSVGGRDSAEGSGVREEEGVTITNWFEL